MPLTHVRTFRVRHYECDAYGHVNYANYLRYMQEAAFDASAAAGYDLDRYEAMGRHWLVRETDIEYLRPLRYGDTVQVKTWVADFRRIRSRRAYEFRRFDPSTEFIPSEAEGLRAGSDELRLSGRSFKRPMNSEFEKIQLFCSRATTEHIGRSELNSKAAQ